MFPSNLSSNNQNIVPKIDSGEAEAKLIIEKKAFNKIAYDSELLKSKNEKLCKLIIQEFAKNITPSIFFELLTKVRGYYNSVDFQYEKPELAALVTK